MVMLEELIPKEYLGREVVLDLSSQFVVLGKLERALPHYFVLVDADVHDLRDSQTTRDRYVAEAREHGLRPNRARTLVALDQLVAVSLLEHVLV